MGRSMFSPHEYGVLHMLYLIIYKPEFINYSYVLQQTGGSIHFWYRRLNADLQEVLRTNEQLVQSGKQPIRMI